MIYKHFNRRLIYHLFMIIACAFALGLSLVSEIPITIQLLVVVILFFSVWSFIQFLNKTNRQISYFIQAIKNDDTTLRFPSRTGNKIINELHSSLNELNLVLQKTKVKSQINERYFSEILQNIGTGVIVFDDKGFISDVNPAALELFGLQTLTHIAQFDRVDPNFRPQIEQFKGGQKQLLVLKIKNEKTQLVSRCSTIKLKDEEVKLLTFQDIHGELERKEIDSWVKLIRVLSHEIMNSLTPVTSITQSLKGMWNDKVKQQDTITPDLIENTINGLEVIGERGQAIIRFVQSYRLLTQVPKIQLNKVYIHNLFDSLSILTSPFKELPNIEIEFKYPVINFELSIDEQMITQVMINLIKNAVEALNCKKNGRIEISAVQKSETHLIINDNGPGIPVDIFEEIFIPFFTTKKDGTGIGLSYSRQVIKAHGGTIKCNSTQGNTSFEVIL